MFYIPNFGTVGQKGAIGMESLKWTALAVLQSETVRGSVPRKAVRASQEGRPRLGAGGAEGAEAVHREQEAPARARGRTYREALCGDPPQLGHTMVTRSKARV